MQYPSMQRFGMPMIGKYGNLLSLSSLFLFKYVATIKCITQGKISMNLNDFTLISFTKIHGKKSYLNTYYHHSTLVGLVVRCKIIHFFG